MFRFVNAKLLVPNKCLLMHALHLHRFAGIKFDDAHIVTSMTAAGSGTLYSWDRGFERMVEIERIEP